MLENLPEIGIVDSREIISAILQTYNYDFDDYALTAFKFRLEKIIHKHKLQFPTYLINKLKADKSFFEVFLKDIQVETTEMFRDPGVWRILREEIIPAVVRQNTPCKILLPCCVSGDELYSLCILLYELHLESNVEITATYTSNLIPDTIKSGNFSAKKAEISEQNYTRSHGLYSLTNYLSVDEQQMIRKNNLLKNVVFVKQHIHFEDITGQYHLIVFRNKLICYNPVLEEKVLKKLDSCLLENGYLITGSQEHINSSSIVKNYSTEYPSESIYKKKQTK
jgi:chemotaxis protein methyltransferase CheR